MNISTNIKNINANPTGAKPNISDKYDKIRLISEIFVLKNVVNNLYPCVTTKSRADQQPLINHQFK